MRRSPVAQHAPHRTPSAWGSALRMLGIGAAVIAVSALGIGGFIAADLALRVSDGAVDLEGAPEVAPPSLGAYPGEFAILLVGTDECGAVSKQKLGERCVREEGIRNDVNLLVHVSEEPRKVSVVSLPRDLMLEVPDCTREDGSVASGSSKAPINSVFERAGLSCVAKSVGELSGIDIGFAAKLSFDGVMKITDAIGGVEICIGGTGIRDRHTGINWDPGPRTVSGYEALQFIRVRKGIGDGSDLARISNQQQYMSRLAKTILSSETLTDPGKVLRLANVVADNVDPSKELANPVRLAQLALALKDVPFDEFKFLQLPTLEDPDDDDRVIVNEEAAAPMWEAIRTGESMQITGKASNHGGVVAEETPTPSAPPSDAPSPAPSASQGVVLSDQISGIDLNQQTCSGGKRR
ncbi:LCP family protein [Microbacterium esteraromaticum]|uniref:LCP family protein n=1 Tax=Microbacterium esteraromaticum TaxID=57043 RepID=UPI00195CEDF9|nr:LCP family protein [Microbacterium esteraromaticum]MBM7466652.1 LCP family protein required for cell wall assembly [Microbacterium esteraromaticum]